jgi:cell division septation protein DedD
MTYKTLSSRVAAGVVTALIAVPFVGVLAANAQDLGPLTFNPSKGIVDSTLTMVTQGGCPKQADGIIAKIYGPGFPVRGQNMIGVQNGNMSHSRSFTVDSAYTLRDLAALPYPAVTYDGTYTVVVTCRTLTNPKSLGDYVGKVVFKTPQAFTTVAGGTTPSTPKPGIPVTTPQPTASTQPTIRPTATPSSSTQAPTASPTTPASSQPSATATVGTTASGSSNTAGPNPILTALIGLLIGAGVVGAVFFVRNRSHATK